MIKEKQLMIGIPTKDHPEYIRYYLAKILRDSRKYNIDIYIYDSSENDETKKIVENRIEQGYTNLFYRHFHKDILIENKLKYIFCDNDYEYIWLCGDGCIAALQKDMYIVEREMSLKRDIILFGDMLDNGKKYAEYTDIKDFLEDCWAPVTYYGGSIVKGNLFTGKQWDSYCIKYKEQVQPACFFEVFKKGDFNGVYIVHDFLEHNPYKKMAAWVKKGRTFDAFAGVMENTISSLPAEYDSSKPKIIKSIDKYTGTFKFNHLWTLRSNGNLDIHKALKYRKQIKKLCIINYTTIFFISLCPRKLAETVAIILGDVW